VEGRGVVLPRRELLILESLVRSRGRVVTRERIVDHAYGIDDDLGSNGLEANISRLRKRLRVAGALVEIRVVRGIGYMIHAAPGRTAP
jgi:DNA-binding response OmpR family regulator